MSVASKPSPMTLMSDPQPTGAFEWTQGPAGRVLRCRPLLEVADHFFTARDLRLRDDEREWARVAVAIDVTPDALRLIRQVHGRGVFVARGADNEGAATAGRRPEADVIVSGDPSQAIAVRVADCAPILIADRRLGVVAAVHAGWRGTIQRAAEAGVAALGQTFGSRPADLIAAIGPSLGPCCGEVGEEVVAAFRDAGHGAGAIARWFTPGPSGRADLDLWRANRDQLEDAGVAAEHIHVAGLCTKTHAAVFHSHRADRDRAGRMAGVIRMRNAER
jgi:polyphenol oxidase